MFSELKSRQNVVIIVTVLLLTFGLIAGAQAKPTIIWTSDPVYPGETVVVQAGDFDADVTVEIGRLSDSGFFTRLKAPQAKDSPIEIGKWQEVKPLQIGDYSVKFAVPSGWKKGVYAYRLISNGEKSEITLINAPDCWWVQGNKGETATPGGWFRVMGKSLNFGGKSVACLKSKGGKPIMIKAKKTDVYMLEFEVSKNVKEGKYCVFVNNGNGGNAAWRKAGEITVQKEEVWPQDVFNVGEILKGYDGDTNKAIREALKMAEINGGGIVFFPFGSYEVKGKINIPDKTVLRADSADLVNIYWSDISKEEAKKIKSVIDGSKFGIEDLTICVQLHTPTVINGSKDSDGIFIRRVRIRSNALYHLQWYGLTVRGRTLDLKKFKPMSAIRMSGKNFEITDCDILSTASTINMSDGSYGYVVGNRFDSMDNGIGMNGLKKMIIEDNYIEGTRGNNLATYGRPYCEQIYIAGNHFAKSYAADREFLTFDGVSSAYCGKIASAEGTTMILANDPFKTKGLFVGTVALILQGRGTGQSRRITAFEGRRWELDRPWDIKLDETSVVTIIPYRGRVLFIDNLLEEGGMVQSYGTSLNSIFARNMVKMSSGFFLWGRGIHGGTQAAFYDQLLDNEILIGNSYGAEKGAFNSGGEFAASFPSAPLNRCHIMRRNKIHNNGFFAIVGGTHDALLERNSISKSPKGVKITADPKYILLRENTFEDVTQVYVDKGFDLIYPRVRPFLDKQEVWLKSILQGVEIRYTTDGSDVTVNSPLYKKPFVVSSTTTVKAKAFENGVPTGPDDSAVFNKIVNPDFRAAKQPKDLVSGLNVKYYIGDWLIKDLPGFADMEPNKTAVSKDLNYLYGLGGIRLRELLSDNRRYFKEFTDESFGMAFSGYIEVPSDGLYTFHLDLRKNGASWVDGARLFIDGSELVINHNKASEDFVLQAFSGEQKVTNNSIPLKAGMHEIVLDYHFTRQRLGFQVSYEGPGIEKQVVPADALWREANK